MESLRLAIRRLRRTPLFSAIAVAILAVGIGANTAMFSVLHAVLLRPLPYTDAERLVTAGESRPGIVGDGLVSLPVYFAWRSRQAQVRVAAYSQWERALGAPDPIVLKTASVSANFFRILGARLPVGRDFTDDEDTFGAPPPRAVVLSFALWVTRFGGDPAVLGRTLAIDGERYRIIGVTPRGFAFPEGAQLWTALLPLMESGQSAISSFKAFNVVGRLADGASIGEVTEALSALAAGVPHNAGWTARVRPLRDAITGDTRAPLLILMSAVALVLLIACANVGNLLLGRGAARSRELMLRAALGASRWRIAGDLFAESVLLVSAGGAIGTLLAWRMLDVLRRLLPVELPRIGESAIDVRVLAFAGGATLFATLATGLAPALRSAAVDPAPALRDTAYGTRYAHGWLRGGIVAAQVAASLALLVGAGLLTRSFVALISVHPGFRTEQVALFEISTPHNRYPTWSAWHGFFSQLTSRVRALPGVASVATVRNAPLSGSYVKAPMVIEGGEALPVNRSAQTAAVSPDYFRTMGIRLVAGRDFEDGDDAGRVAVAIVSQSFARAFFPGTSAVGKRARPYFGGPTLREIIGIVEDVHQTGLTTSPEPMLYTLAAHQGGGPLTLVVRSSIPIEALTPMVRSIVRALDPDQPIGSVTTMGALLSRSVARPRFMAALFGGFAAIAVALAMIGLSAVMSQFLAQSRQEIAVRLAMGARPADVFLLQLGRGLQLVLIGVAVGTLGALAGGRALSALLFGIGAADLATFVTTSATIIIIAAATIAVDAWRASRLDPMIALRA